MGSSDSTALKDTASARTTNASDSNAEPTIIAASKSVVTVILASLLTVPLTITAAPSRPASETFALTSNAEPENTAVTNRSVEVKQPETLASMSIACRTKTASTSDPKTLTSAKRIVVLQSSAMTTVTATRTVTTTLSARTTSVNKSTAILTRTA